MNNRKYDKLLGIKTTGIREWKDGVIHYNRYEATSYLALDTLFKNYKLNKSDKVVDFGCGRGRVAFYIHNLFKVPVTGIEANETTFEEAIINNESYNVNSSHINAKIDFKRCYAEHYQIEETDNIFYFFNPFSIFIFQKVIYNILHSVNKNNRTIDIILYYPMTEYTHFLENYTPFQLVQEIILDQDDNFEKFLIYRLEYCDEFLIDA